ncbi:MAG: class D sortase [Eubacteriales bacterium]
MNTNRKEPLSSPEVNPAKSIEAETPARPPITSPSEDREDESVYATITIQTDKKTKTFDIYQDIKEATLDQHIGHLPSSVAPGEDGLCVLMGHRDRELKILQYTKVGDVFTIQKNSSHYRYKVTRIEIQDNDESLSFPVANGRCLAIVTCYPFDFLGSAPQRIIIYAELLY